MEGKVRWFGEGISRLWEAQSLSYGYNMLNLVQVCGNVKSFPNHLYAIVSHCFCFFSEVEIM